MLARDLQSVVLYDQEGKFAGIRRPNSKLPIEIDGLKIVVVDAIGSSGLNLKVKDMTSPSENTYSNYYNFLFQSFFQSPFYQLIKG